MTRGREGWDSSGPEGHYRFIQLYMVCYKVHACLLHGSVLINKYILSCMHMCKKWDEYRMSSVQ